MWQQGGGARLANKSPSLPVHGGTHPCLPTGEPTPACRSLHINELANVPGELGNLVGLEALSLHSNHLTDLPPQISRLTSCLRLSLYQNPDLRRVPPEMGQMTALKVGPAWWEVMGARDSKW